MGTVSNRVLYELLTTRELSVLATLKRDGRPQLSNVNHIFEPDTKTLRISITADRAKARNLARDPRVSLHVMSKDGWSWAVAEGRAELVGPAQHPDDDTVEALVDLYRAIRGEHPDWDEYRAAMVAESRIMVRVPVEHVYGQVP